MTFSKNGTWLTFNKEFTLFYQFTSLDLGLGTTDFLGCTACDLAKVLNNRTNK